MPRSDDNCPQNAPQGQKSVSLWGRLGLKILRLSDSLFLRDIVREMEETTANHQLYVASRIEFCIRHRREYVTVCPACREEEMQGIDAARHSLNSRPAGNITKEGETYQWTDKTPRFLSGPSQYLYEEEE